MLIQSSSAAGKTSLLEATLAADAARSASCAGRPSPASRSTTWAASELKHKILAVAEEEGVAEASYALKLLQSEGRLRIAVAGKDSDTGRPQTEHYEVEGPVAMLLTTTARTNRTRELANRCLTLSVNEAPAADRRHPPAAAGGLHAGGSRRRTRSRSGTRHQHAQRLLEPLGVVIPWAEQLTFRTDQTRYRRDHAKYLSLIASITLLHQHQRPRVTRGHGDQAEACVVAAADDLRTANRLASQVLGARCDGLLPQTRQLLAELDQYVAQRSQAQAIARRGLRLHAASSAGSVGLERPGAAAATRAAGGVGIRAGLPRWLRQPTRLPAALRRPGRRRRAVGLGPGGCGAAGGRQAGGSSRIGWVQRVCSALPNRRLVASNRRPVRANRRPFGGYPAAMRRPAKTRSNHVAANAYAANRHFQPKTINRTLARNASHAHR